LGGSRKYDIQNSKARLTSTPGVKRRWLTSGAAGKELLGFVPEMIIIYRRADVYQNAFW
jgi:hypothetical protein